MRIPRRSVNSYVGLQLPSLITLPSSVEQSPISEKSISEKSISEKSSLRKIIAEKCVQDGIEVVPIERSKSCTTKILSPGQEEKEVVFFPESDVESAKEDTLIPPSSWWGRLSIKRRVILVLGIQACLLLILGLCLFFTVKRSYTDKKASSSSVNSSVIASVPKPSFPRGAFVLSGTSTTDRERHPGCLTSLNETAAWDCRNRTILINFLPSPSEESNSAMAFLQFILPDWNSSNWPNAFYGPQNPGSSPLTFEVDTSLLSTSDGPAYHFRAVYNRAVLLPRVSQDTTPAFVTPLEPNSTPWLCTFNETVIEGYIYPSLNSSKSGLTYVSDDLGNNGNVPSAGREIPYLPYITKIIEQKTPGSIQPQCTMVSEGDQGHTEPVQGVAPINLIEPNVISKADAVKAVIDMRRQEQDTDCRCQWTYF
ncbi:hypothetical protein BU24DRAFT_459452 [Aaosphaeria arxii CBS 175.79]|uniref:DUF7820 domain-containing protein n=1 Tax=Aaosphaeria arxii CBS 175.79 TaxID=1450172 RepID=A0A6A5Y3N0_9PLEO|nr:uncharacterized protein BU24DRAFT_459452 [Aaosphaeria arxii CBS 175.79]KAF2019823.1 hypothetical protein BU24DRAFT_459452 [Aaosphaeria arxii CBS 175.79]